MCGLLINFRSLNKGTVWQKKKKKKNFLLKKCSKVNSHARWRLPREHTGIVLANIGSNIRMNGPLKYVNFATSLENYSYGLHLGYKFFRAEFDKKIEDCKSKVRIQLRL
jgi:hypothetical protein